MKATACNADYCTPGMLTRAYRLLQENPNPSDEEIRMGISGNLCRCTGYQNIVKAIRYAADKINQSRGSRLMTEAARNDAGRTRGVDRWHRNRAPNAKRTRASFAARANYVDDIKLPGMLHGDFVRSSHAHALIKSINTEAALKPWRACLR